MFHALSMASCMEGHAHDMSSMHVDTLLRTCSLHMCKLHVCMQTHSGVRLVTFDSVGYKLMLTVPPQLLCAPMCQAKGPHCYWAGGQGAQLTHYLQGYDMNRQFTSKVASNCGMTSDMAQTRFSSFGLHA